ncbi:DUF1353 domain-containing protein [Spiribacter onubensis]|uniref:DUF1353 domain-containing protein n=1 Tax=Spiribacter onubensis TaxID=3122420 RepID=A0ABV3S740_9GAMM
MANAIPDGLGELDIERESDRWRLIQPLTYKEPDLLVKVPAGFGTDLDSVPRVPGVYALAKGRAVKSAVIHDYLYREQRPRVFADAVLLRAMKTEGVSRPMRWIIYGAVRAFGWIPYRRIGQGKTRVQRVRS